MEVVIMNGCCKYEHEIWLNFSVHRILVVISCNKLPLSGVNSNTIELTMKQTDAPTLVQKTQVPDIRVKVGRYIKFCLHRNQSRIGMRRNFTWRLTTESMAHSKINISAFYSRLMQNYTRCFTFSLFSDTHLIFYEPETRVYSTRQL